MLNNEMVTVSSGNFLPPAVKNSDPDSIASGKYDELGAFLVKNPDIRVYTAKDAVKLKTLCNELKVAFNPLQEFLGVTRSYLGTKFAELPASTNPGRSSRVFVKREFRQLLERGGQAPTPVPLRDPAKKTAREVPSETRKAEHLSITIEGPGLSLKRAIASSDDVARITALLEALTR